MDIQDQQTDRGADEKYRELEYISHSALSEFKRILKGEPAKLDIKPETLEAGRQLHLNAFEPDKYNIETDNNAANTRNMIYSLNNNLVYSFMRKSAGVKLEWQRFWTCPHTGVRCKGKLDMKLGVQIADLKGTSCKTKEEFIQTISLYDYHRQAAFYLDGDKAERFLFVGVQKKYPFKTFTHIMEKDDPLIMNGREEYVYLIRTAIAKGMLTTKFATND